MLAKKFEQWNKLKDAVSQKLADKEAESAETKPNLTIQETGQPENPSETEVKVINFNFQTVLTLKHLWQFWQNSSKKPFRNIAGAAIEEAIGGKVMLTEKLDNFAAFKVHPGLVETLTNVKFSWEMWDEKLVGLSQPFQIQNIYANSHFAEKLYEGGVFAAEPTLGNDRYNEQLMFAAYGIILKDLYQFEPSHVVPRTSFIFQKKSGDHFDYYKLSFDYSYMRPVSRGGTPRLSTKDKDAISQDHSLSQLMKILPPEAFDFEGVMLVSAENATESHSLSCIRDIIRTQDIHEKRTQEEITDNIRAFLKDNSVVIDGLINHNFRIKRLVDRDDSNQEIKTQDFDESLYNEVLEQDYVEQYPPGSITEELLDQLPGLHRCTNGNLFLIPLKFKNYRVGVFELQQESETPFPPIKLRRLKAVLQEEIERQVQEYRNSILSVILEKYTAIHPTVEWAFRDAAQDFVNQKKAGQMAELQPIVFRRVHPLYGASDIRGSSNQRNLAIQQDLKDQIIAAKSVIETAIEYSPMPKLQEIRFRLDSEIDRITEGLLAGDEITVLEFLNGEVEAVFEAISVSIPEARSKIATYKETINNDHGVFYKARKNFDNSVTLLNEAIAAYYDEEQTKFQGVFPHYFEKQSTDGVDHTAYIGPALSKDRTYHAIYLENIRIWQIMVVCGAAYVGDKLKNSLPVPLALTHLIVVQDNPLDIRFSLDEKQFEVDGAYNVRYEIMKKRIDKAKVKGQDERLTQPGKLAIVYSQKKEKADYTKYINYLRSEGYFTDDPEEDLEIDDLQGISGLRALRVNINLRTFPKSQDAKSGSLTNVVSNSRRWLLQKRKEMEDTASKVSDVASSYSKRKLQKKA